MAATIRDIYLQFDPLEPLPDRDPRYVDCLKERGLSALFEGISLPLSKSPRPLLFSGHIGDGKTTILNQFRRRLEQEENDFVAYGEASDRLDLGDVEYNDVLLAILAVVNEALQERYRTDMAQNPFKDVWDDLCRIASLPAEFNKIETSLGFVKLTTTVKDSPDMRLQVRQGLRLAGEQTFLQVVNQYVERAQQIVRSHGHRQLVVIMDNLDRLSEIPLAGDIYLDERLFLGNASQLLAVKCHVIYTVRLALIRTQSSNLTARYGQNPTTVPIVPVRHRDGSPHEAGLLKLREIIQRRLTKADLNSERAFDRIESLNQLCHASGGYLRQLMTLMESTCAEALAAHGTLPLRENDVRAAIGNSRAELRLLAADYAEPLQQISQTHEFAGIPPATRSDLLRQRLVYEYLSDGSYWYDVSPLLDE